MQIITTWTAGHADALRQALRMTNESFAEHLGVAVRTVASWRKRPEIVPQPAMQETLDAALERAPDRAKAQFALLVAAVPAGTDAPSGDTGSGIIQYPAGLNDCPRMEPRRRTPSFTQLRRRA